MSVDKSKVNYVPTIFKYSEKFNSPTTNQQKVERGERAAKRRRVQEDEYENIPEAYLEMEMEPELESELTSEGW